MVKVEVINYFQIFLQQLKFQTQLQRIFLYLIQWYNVTFRPRHAMFNATAGAATLQLTD